MIGKKTITLDKKQIKKSLTKNEDGTYTITITGKDKNCAFTSPSRTRTWK